MACTVATATTISANIAARTSKPSTATLAIMLRQQYGGRSMSVQTMMIPILIRAFAPLPPLLSFSLPANASVAYILAAIVQNLRLPARVAQMLRLTRLGGQTVSANTAIGSLTGPPVRNQFGQMVLQPVTLEVRMGMRGGKGGFGSQLRAAGGKMSSSRNGEENRDSCRDLNGRRLSTVKQAQQLAAYVATQDDRQRAMNEAQKKKYAKLERMLGRKPHGEADFIEAAQKLHDQGGDLEEDADETVETYEDSDERRPVSAVASSSKPLAKRTNFTETSRDKGKKRERIEDHEYVEQSRAIVDNVRSAVASAMLKKKRKNSAPVGKTNSISASASSATEDSTKNAKSVQAV